MAAADHAFHMPGHRAGAGAPPLAVELLGAQAFRADVSEVGGAFDYLHGPTGAIAAAQRRAASMFGAARSWFLVNGASVGNLAALVATVAEGDEVLLARSSHRSVLGGLVLSGATPVYLPPSPDLRLDGFFGVSVPDVRRLLVERPAIRALHVTSPDYYGFAVAVDELAAACHDAGVLLVVDEAHGAHLAFDDRLPPSAVAAGADVVVQSPHKTLGSLTQSALLHLCGDRGSPERLAAALALLQSSSPSALLTVSLDLALDALADPTPVRAAVDLALQARSAIGSVPGLELVDPSSADGPVRRIDPTKLVVDVTGLGTTGFAAATWLRSHRLAPEFADLRRVVCSVTLADSSRSVDALVAGLTAMAASPPHDTEASDVVGAFSAELPEVVVTPREASRRPAQTVPLEESVGRLAAEAAIPYPPGIPLVAPGERITASIVSSLRRLAAAGSRIVGPADASVATLRCLEP